MSLVGPWLSTTATKKRKEKFTKAQMAEFEQRWRDRNAWLKQMHMPKQTFDDYMEWLHGRGKKTNTKEKNRTASQATTSAPAEPIAKYHESVRVTGNNRRVPAMVLKDWPPAPCTVKPSPMYTGDNMLCVSQLHKSNAIPVFRQEDIVDIARMRR